MTENCGNLFIRERLVKYYIFDIETPYSLEIWLIGNVRVNFSYITLYSGTMNYSTSHLTGPILSKGVGHNRR